MSPPREPSAITAMSAPALPSLARFHRSGGDPGWFVVVDPAGRHPALGRAERSIDLGPAIRTIVYLVCILGCGLLAARDRSSAPVTLLFFLLGGAGGALLGGLVTALLNGVLPQTWHRPAKDGPRLRVQPTDGQAWRLCETVAALASTTSWTDRTVDPGRRAPAILWAAVGRSLEVQRQDKDARRALEHESLQDIGRATLAGLTREHDSLDAIETNLRMVLGTARDIDRRRAELERLRRSRAEERELRGRMAAGHGALADRAETDRQADLSAGLAAEAEAVSQLLAASDALLHDLD